QSFFGDIAARLLGDALLVWLWRDIGHDAEVASIRQSLDTRLHSLTGAATEVVQKQQLPSHIPEMLHDVLEQKRAMGSESTFVCGKVTPPSPQSPGGQVVLAWLGDSRLRLWGPQGERTHDLAGAFEKYERWSTLRGPV